MTQPANVEQARAWDGDEGEHWTDHEDEYNGVGRRQDRYLFEAARILADDHVLDVGCGCGLSTRAAARRAGSGVALGLDLSGRMIERARERSRLEGPDNVTFEQAEAQTYPFAGQVFDVVISRFGAMFFADPVAAFANIGGAMRSGGRLTLLTWQEFRDNEWLADPDVVRRTLTGAGFGDVIVDPVREPICLGADAAKAFGFVSGLGITRGLLNDLDDAARASALDKLLAVLADHQTSEGVLFNSSAWLVTARRP